MQTKCCKTCGEVKPAAEFYKNTTLSDGLSSSCKVCKRRYAKSYRTEHAEEHRASAREYYQRHKEERAAYYAKWRLGNLDALAAYHRQWRRDNPDIVRQQRKVANARRRARVAQADGDFTPTEWAALCEQYGYVCLACGRGEPEVKITPDHIVPLANGGSNGIDNIQPLCWGCNASKQDRIVDYRQRDIRCPVPEIA
jgi:5-methylcytosine-specific restriction endonuclease McrA